MFDRQLLETANTPAINLKEEPSQTQVRHALFY